MKIITLVSAGRENPMAAVAELLAEHQINIESCEFLQVDEHSFLSLGVKQYDESLALLLTAGYNAVADDFVILRGENRPGELAEIARTLADAGVQIRSLTLLETRENSGLVSIATDSNKVVRELFSKQLVN